MSRLDAYISRYGDFCANDDDTTNYFTPCACMRGKYLAKNNVHLHTSSSNFVHRGGETAGGGPVARLGAPAAGGVVAAGYLWQPEMVYMYIIIDQELQVHRPE